MGRGNGSPLLALRRWGRGRDARLAIDEEDAIVVKRIFDLFVGNLGPPMSLYSIASLLTNEGIR